MGVIVMLGFIALLGVAMVVLSKFFDKKTQKEKNLCQ